MSKFIPKYCKDCKHCSMQRTFASECRLLSQHVFDYILIKQRKTLPKVIQEAVIKKDCKGEKLQFTKNIGNAVWVSFWFLGEYIDAFHKHPTNQENFKILTKRLWMDWLDYRKNVFVKIIDTLAIVTGAWMIYVNYDLESLGIEEMMEWFLDILQESIATEFFEKGSWKMLDEKCNEWYSGLFTNLKSFIRTDNLDSCKLVKYVRESPVYLPIPKRLICESCQKGCDKDYYRKVIYLQPEWEFHEKAKTLLNEIQNLNDIDSKKDCLKTDEPRSLCYSLSGTKKFDKRGSSKRTLQRTPVCQNLIASLKKKAENEKSSSFPTLNDNNLLKLFPFANKPLNTSRIATLNPKVPILCGFIKANLTVKLEKEEFSTAFTSKMSAFEPFTPMEQKVDKLPKENLTDYYVPRNSFILDAVSQNCDKYVQNLKVSLCPDEKERNQTDLHLLSKAYSNSFKILLEETCLDYMKCVRKVPNSETNLKPFMYSKSNPPDSVEHHPNVQSIQDHVSGSPIYQINNFMHTSFEFYFLGNPKKSRKSKDGR